MRLAGRDCLVGCQGRSPISVWPEGKGTAGFRVLKPMEGKANLFEKAGDRYFFALSDWRSGDQVYQLAGS
jgi:hypothetical protein